MEIETSEGKELLKSKERRGFRGSGKKNGISRLVGAHSRGRGMGEILNVVIVEREEESGL